MKKLLSLVLAMLMVFSMAVVASAENTTTLTTTVPAATYTLNIPADQEVAFGATKTEIGNVTITDSSSFAEGKNVQVKYEYTPFTSSNTSTIIPVQVNVCYTSSSYTGSSMQYTDTNGLCEGNLLTFSGLANGSVEKTATAVVNSKTYRVNNLALIIKSTDWGKALAGEYTATITFTAEVVVQ